MPAKVTLSNGAVVKPTVDPDTIPNIIIMARRKSSPWTDGQMDGWDKYRPTR